MKVGIDFVRMLAENKLVTRKNYTIYHSGGKGDDFIDVDKLIGNSSSRSKLVEYITQNVQRMV